MIEFITLSKFHIERCEFFGYNAGGNGPMGDDGKITMINWIAIGPECEEEDLKRAIAYLQDQLARTQTS